MEKYLKPEEVADILQVEVNTLTNWRTRGVNLPYLKPSGKCILYKESDVYSYIESTLVEVKSDDS